MLARRGQEQAAGAGTKKGLEKGDAASRIRRANQD